MLQHQAFRLGNERAMHFAGGTAGVVAGVHPQVEGFVVEMTGNDENFLGVVVGLGPRASVLAPVLKRVRRV
jgi:hypothetical protein